MQITKANAVQKILHSNGKIFTVTFIKKDKTSRNMNCRLGVKKYVKGVGLKYNPTDKNLIIVYDLQKKDYRSFNVNTVINLKINKQDYDVV
jgi:hypothetical protein